jgi:hypothetical protein
MVGHSFNQLMYYDMDCFRNAVTRDLRLIQQKQCLRHFWHACASYSMQEASSVALQVLMPVKPQT